MEDRKSGLSQEGLKLIACISMLIDHFGVSIVRQLNTPWMIDLYYVCRIIGRFAFPIYCFLLVEGMRHTRNPGKYILRLAIGILLAELPFDLLFEGGFTWGYQSVMVTLTLGAMMLLCMQKTAEKVLQLLLIVPFAILAELCKCDGGAGGIVMIAIFAIFDQLSLQAAALFLVNWQMIPSVTVTVFGVVVIIQLIAVVAMVPISLYSGRKLSHSKALQWGFYLFYPLHLLILWMIVMFIR